MSQTSKCELPHEDAKHEENTLALRTTVTFSEDDLSDEAKAQFKFHDEILRTFQFYANHVLANERLSPIGRHFICSALEQNHMNSKLVLNYMASHPELKKTAKVMPHPLVICGLPRAGTTLLYNLLTCDPACRATLYAEISHPVPPLARSDTAGQVQRNNALQGFREMLSALGLNDHLQGMRGSHPQFAYEEDLYILYHAGYSMFYTLIAPHDDEELLLWLEDDTNKNFMYEYHKTFIQMVNSVDTPHSHWLLKTPFHSLYLDQLLKQYSSAMLIMCHRRLEDVLPSICRLTTTYVRFYFDNNQNNTAVDIRKVVKRTLHWMDTLIHRLVAFRRNHPDIPCFDVRYDDLMAQPLETVRRIYHHFNLQWSEEFEMAMSTWLRDNPQGKQGRNPYTLSDYEMTSEEVQLRYKDYISMFLDSQHSSDIDAKVNSSESSSNE